MNYFDKDGNRGHPVVSPLPYRLIEGVG